MFVAIGDTDIRRTFARVPTIEFSISAVALAVVPLDGDFRQNATPHLLVEVVKPLIGSRSGDFRHLYHLGLGLTRPLVVSLLPANGARHRVVC